MGVGGFVDGHATRHGAAESEGGLVAAGVLSSTVSSTVSSGPTSTDKRVADRLERWSNGRVLRAVVSATAARGLAAG